MSPNTQRQWMLFVDGENFTIRGQKVAQDHVTLTEGQHYRRNCFVWYPGWSAKARLASPPAIELETYALRAYYYTSVVGDDTIVGDVTRKLWNIGFTPEVFKRSRDQSKSKGVDIALCKDMLSHAFQGHYDAAVLLAGDGDYVPLVEQVKRLGKVVHVWFFSQEGLNSTLQLAADGFYDLTDGFVATWVSAVREGRT